MFGNAASQVLPEFPFHEFWNGTFPIPATGKESFQLGGHDTVQDRLFRFPRNVVEFAPHAEASKQRTGQT